MKILSVVLWPYYKLRQPWTDNVKQFEYLVSAHSHLNSHRPRRLGPPRFALRVSWKDQSANFATFTQDWDTQRRLAIRQIDKGGFGYWTVFVAGLGFLTDS